MENTFFYHNYLDDENNTEEIHNENGEIVDDPMEDIYTNITDPRIVLETITSHNQYQENKPDEKISTPKEEPYVETTKKTKKSRAKINADYSDITRYTFIDRMLEQPGGMRNAKLIGGNLGVHYKTAQRWWNSYEETGEIPYKKSTRNTGRPRVFTSEHKVHVQTLIDDHVGEKVCQ